MSIIDYAGEAPDFTAWAGEGPHADRIYESGDHEAMVELRARYNTAVARMVSEGDDPADAMASVEVEAIAANIQTEERAKP